MTLNASIDIGMSGLNGFAQQLQIISNNVANLNTPGFKGSSAQFADYFGSNGGAFGNQAGTGGNGVHLLPSVINFAHGQLTQTGVSTNMVINGSSFFVLKDPKSGQLSYTQNGQFSFNADGFLVDSSGLLHVQGTTAGGGLQDISIDTYRNSAAKASTTITLNGNLNNGGTPASYQPITVFDAAGGSHQLTVTLTAAAAAGGVIPVTVSVSDGSTTIFTGQVQFNGTSPFGPASGHNAVSFNYTPSGAAAVPLTLTMDGSMTANALASSIGLKSVDGYAPGTLTSEAFDQNGILQLSYSNGQKVSGPSVALALFQAPDQLKPNGNNTFIANNSNAAQLGTAGANSAWGTVAPGAIEASNVDLSTEFSLIITTQRGYQAASELISTANQMMQEVLQMKGQGG